MLNEGGKENLFLREKVELALTEIVVVMCENDYGETLLNLLNPHSNSNNKVVQALAETYIQMTREKLDISETINLDGITSTQFIECSNNLES